MATDFYYFFYCFFMFILDSHPPLLFIAFALVCFVRLNLEFPLSWEFFSVFFVLIIYLHLLSFLLDFIHFTVAKR